MQTHQPTPHLTRLQQQQTSVAQHLAEVYTKTHVNFLDSFKLYHMGWSHATVPLKIMNIGTASACVWENAKFRETASLNTLGRDVTPPYLLV
jgi:hypothetical protein